MKAGWLVKSPPAGGGGHLQAVQLVLLYRALSLAVQCIVIGPVCGFVCVCVCLCVCLWVCYHDNSKLRASILTIQTGFVGKGSDHLQLIKFWPCCAPGKGVCGRAKITANSQCLRLSGRFFHLD